MPRIKYTSAGVPKQYWSATRSMIIERAFNDAKAQGVAYFADKEMFEFLVQAAESVGKYQEFEATPGTVKERLVADLRTMLTEHSVPNTVRGIILETRQEQVRAKRRIGIPGIVVTTTSGEVLAVRRPGMEAVNMSTALEQEAATAGVQIVKRQDVDASDGQFLDKNGRPLTGAALAARQRAASGEKAPATQRAPKAPSLCEFSGQPTNGGRFLPGYDAKLKSALMLRYRDEKATIAPPEMSAELRERFATGDLSTSEGAYAEAIKRSWEKFMTDRPSSAARKAAAKAPDDGLGVGNFEVRDIAGEVIQRTASDTAALEWAVANGMDVLTSNERSIVVEPAEDADNEDNEDNEDDEDDEDDSDEDESDEDYK